MTRTLGAALLDLAARLRLEDLPKPVVAHARLAVLDWWGVTVAGAGEPVARLVRETLDGPEGEASVLGAGRTAPPVTAALWNGTAAHALDYDDTVLDLPGHVTAPVLPALIALAETRGLGGAAVLAALVAGVEVMCRLGRALRPGHYRAGWHATATLGRLGGAAAAARLLGLDAAGVDRAVGLAAAQAGGIQESFGTMAKPFQVGRAAADALLAALLAERGVSGPARVLDADGWARRWSGDWRPERLGEGLGEVWAMPEVLFKRYPCCFATHAAVRALLALRPRLEGAALEAVDLEVCPTTLQVADQREPRTGLAGKFSVRHCAAVALLRGRVEEADFTEAAVGDGDTRALAARVRVRPAPDLDETRARVVVRLAGGTVREARADLRADAGGEGLGEELAAKFQSLVAPRLGAGAAGRLRAALGALEDVDDVRAMLRTVP